MEERDDFEEVLLPEGWTEGEDIFQNAEEPMGSLTTADEEHRENMDTLQNQPENAEPERKTYRLRVNHEDREVSLTEEEIRDQLQKSYAFDEMRARGRIPEVEEVAKERDFVAEVEDAKRLFPDVREITDEVAAAVAHGVPLTTALAAFRAKEARTEAAHLKLENEVLKQNEKNRQRAIVTGLTGYSTGQARNRDFLSGLESDW